jgi:hypothetical protein
MFTANYTKNKLTISDSLPPHGSLGQLLFNVSDDTYYFYDGSTWKPLGGGGGGAVPSTYVIAAYNSNNPNRADYKCTGTDDHLVIQQAIDDLPYIGGSIYLLEGDYNLGGDIIFNKMVNIYGTGSATHLVGNYSSIKVNAPSIINDMSIYNTTLRFNSNMSNVRAVVMRNQGIPEVILGDESPASVIFFHNCYFVQYGLGIINHVQLKTAVNIIFSNSSFTRGPPGFGQSDVFYCANDSVSRINIINSNFLGRIRHVFNLVNFNLSNLNFVSNFGDIFSLVNADANSSLSLSTFSNNNFNIVAPLSLFKFTGDSNTITNNVVQTSAPFSNGYAISFEGSRNIINNNRIEGSGTSVGIRETGSSDYNDISHNNLSNFTTPIVLVGAHSQALGNIV